MKLLVNVTSGQGCTQGVI